MNTPEYYSFARFAIVRVGEETYGFRIKNEFCCIDDDNWELDYCWSSDLRGCLITGPIMEQCKEFVLRELKKHVCRSELLGISAYDSEFEAMLSFV